ncbi:MAG: threonine--tRNA ligase [Bdellovibrionota bacterium]
MKVHITLPDGTQREFERGVTSLDVLKTLGRRLEKDALAAVLNGKTVDLTLPIEADASFKVITRDSAEGLEILRHSTAHLLAHAVKELYPKSQITIGPVTEDGFYYDISYSDQFTPDDLAKLEKRMQEIVKRDYPVSRKIWQRDEAVAFFKGQGELYKAEIIQDLDSSETISTYQQGDFVDLCRGPHVPNLGRLGKFKLLSVAGAYWRGDEKNEMLQRIYGTAFPDQKSLDEHLHRLEEAKRRDHRKLGPEMELFSFLPISPAMAFFQPKGTTLYLTLLEFVRKEMNALGYQEVACPQLMTVDLWKTSGHWEHFKDNMFVTGHHHTEAEENWMGLKPMNCPGHAAFFKTKKHSYRELPIRFAEFTKVHRDERAGVTHGLFRTRTFSIDDGHVFCTEDQVADEVQRTLDHTLRIYKAVGFNDVEIKLATRPPSSLGTDEMWERSIGVLANCLKKAGVEYEVLDGEGAFYGPKIEFHVRDSLNRRWQCGTIQYDPNLPERFDLEYVDSDGQSKRPVMIHRAVLGSFERFLGILIEHHGGHLPLWLAPTQVVVISLTGDQIPYAEEIGKFLNNLGVRHELDTRNEKLGYKIREAQLKRVPLMVILGKKEEEAKVLSVRKHDGENLQNLTLDAFKEYLSPQLVPGGMDH